jgi:predicted MFS family arabinose efflux permease
MVTGLFGGVIGSISFAIITDLFPFNQRGRVMGVVQTSFAASQVMGLPLGLFLSNLWGWHAPFLMILSFSTVAGVLIAIYMKPIDAHLKARVHAHAVHHGLRREQRGYPDGESDDHLSFHRPVCGDRRAARREAQ